MAKTKQFTIAVENKPGAVLKVAKALGDAKVNILALLAAAQGSNGSVQLIAEDPKRARKAVDDASIGYQEAEAEHLELANKPGALAQTLNKLAAKGVNLSSICAIGPKGGRKAIVIYTAEVAEKAAAATA